MTPEQKKQFLLAQANFISNKPCTFPGYQDLKKSFDAELSNLGSGCSRCKKNAIKRRYIMKIQNIFKQLP
jgi:hypothetical protein